MGYRRVGLGAQPHHWGEINPSWKLFKVRKFAFNTSSLIKQAEADTSRVLLFLTFLFESSVESLGSPSSFFLSLCVPATWAQLNEIKIYISFTTSSFIVEGLMF